VRSPSAERWWAPARGTLEPDAVVKVLLEPDDNGDTDLATTLLAVHRAGAAACETVSRSPVPSELGLISAMAVARQAFAPAAVDAVAKNLEESYAGLLVRDVLSEAERTTVTLFRTAVAKGVSPPLAVQRAGAVYGVPARELGRYLALAFDPKTNPLALTDAADRALLTYVSKLSAAEAEDPGSLVTFSKAPGQGQGQGQAWEEREHPRGPDGQFVEAPEPEAAARMGSLAWIRATLGLGDTSPPQVAEETGHPRETPPAKAVARPQRAQRAKRAKRLQRAPARAAPERAPRERVFERTHARAALQRAMKRGEARLDRALAAAPPARQDPDLHPVELMRKFSSNVPADYYHVLDQSVGIALPQSVGQWLLDGLHTQQDQGQMVFRVGNIIGRPGVDVEDTKSPEMRNAIRAAADHTWTAAMNPPDGGEGLEEPEVETITLDEIGALADPDAYIESRVRDKASYQSRDEHGMARSVYDEAEGEHVHVMEDYVPFGQETKRDAMGAPENERRHIVYYHSVDPGNPDVRQMPTVHELVIAGGAVGAVEGTGKNIEIELDPNQTYLLHPRAKKYFDPDRNVIVLRWTTTAVSDDEVEALGFEKSLEGAAASAFEQEHPRDTEGRFSEKEGRPTTAAPTAVPVASQRTARLQRPKRLQRAKRLTRQSREAAALPTHERVLERAPRERSARSQAVRRVFLERAQARAERHGAQKQLPELDDQQDYRVWSDKTFEYWADEFLPQSDRDELNSGNWVQLWGRAKNAIAEGDHKDAGSLVHQMAYNVQDEMRTEGEYFRVLGSMPVTDVTDDSEIAERIDHYFDADPDLDIVEVVRHGNKLHFSGNPRPAKSQNIIEIDRDLDFTKPVYITYIDDYRARDGVIRHKDGTTSSLVDLSERLGEPGTPGSLGEKGTGTAVPNPHVHIYRVTNARVRRYGLSND
jgi:hypothetical protein